MYRKPKVIDIKAAAINSDCLLEKKGNIFSLKMRAFTEYGGKWRSKKGVQIKTYYVNHASYI